MIRLLVHVEGRTESDFVDSVLAPHLFDHGFSDVSPRLVGNPRQQQRAHRGGARTWPAVRKGILNHLKSDRQVFATTMFDFYRLPPSWPGRALAVGATAHDIASNVEAALQQDLANDIDPRRFIPFITMHEFEGLLFSNCTELAASIQRPDLQSDLQSIRDRFASPEEINDSSETAPSKRILKLYPRYEKVVDGNQIAKAIGLGVLRRECSHFDSWIRQLERLPKSRG